MIRQLILSSTIAIALAVNSPAAQAGDADKVLAVDKGGLVLQGEVASTDAKVKVIVGDKSGALPAKLFLVQLTAGKRYRISMDSKEFDSFLMVQDMAGKQLAWDDDSGGDLNSLLTLDVPKDGTYKIYAASLKGTGKFLLKIGETKTDEPVNLPLDDKQKLVLKEAVELEKRAHTLYLDGRYGAAIGLMTKVVGFRKQVLGAKHLQNVPSLGNLGSLFLSIGDYSRAEPLFLQALSIYKSELGDTHLHYGQILINLANLHRSKRQYDKAEAMYLQVLKIFSQVPESNPHTAGALNDLAKLYYLKNVNDKAEPLFRRALEIRGNVFGKSSTAYAESLNDLAVMYSSNSEFAKAEPSFVKALDIYRKSVGDRHRDYAIALTNLATMFEMMDDYGRAEPLFLAALDVFKRHEEDDINYASSLHALGRLYCSKGDFFKAEPVLRSALEIRKRVVGENDPEFADNLNDLAAVYESKGEYARAERLLLQALEIKRQEAEGKTRGYAISLQNLAFLYHATGDMVKAEKMHLSALGIRKEVVGEKHPDYSNSLNNLGGLYLSQKESGKARTYFLDALTNRKAVFGEQSLAYAQTMNNLAGVCSAAGDLKEAESLYLKSLLALRLDQNGGVDSFEQLNSKDLKPTQLSLEILENAALLLEKRYSSPNNVQGLRTCDHVFGLTLELQDRMRRDSLEHEDSRVLQIERHFRIFSNRIGVLKRLFDLESRPGDLNAAFSTAEQGLARTFLDSLGKRRKNLLAGVGLELQTEEKELLQKIWTLDSRIDKEAAKTLAQRAPSLIGQLLDQRLEWEAKLNHLILRLEKEYPQYAGFKHPRSCNLEEARACLAPNEVALLFMPGTEASFIVLVEARPAPGDKANGLAIFELPGKAVLGEHVAALNDLESLALPARIKALGREAFDAILGPCKNRIESKQVVLVPNEALCYLPFELLVEEDGKYLVEKHRIRYAPSLTALHLINLWKEKRAQPTATLFAVGDPVYESGQPPSNPRINTVVASRNDDMLRDLGWREGKEGFKRLVQSGQEVAEIARMLGAKADYVLTSENASEAKVKAASTADIMAKARYVHFATHGILGVDKGKQPALVLNLVGNTGEDGFLEYEEILNLKLNADLVVLSACRTGQGRMARGEGVTGLARAFLYAGSKGVVCSLWSVDDRETANLMVDFYGHLKEGQPAADALREAQLAMIRAGKAPLYWAPFILIGE